MTTVRLTRAVSANPSYRGLKVALKRPVASLKAFPKKAGSWIGTHKWWVVGGLTAVVVGGTVLYLATRPPTNPCQLTCSSDCDCPSGMTCSGGCCQNGTNNCKSGGSGSCTPPCDPGYVCIGGTCYQSQIPIGWNGPSSFTVNSNVCQPTTLYGPGCCGNAKVTVGSAQFALQVVDIKQNGVPNLVVSANSNDSTTVALDANQYVTDGHGYIYPIVTNLYAPTCCDKDLCNGGESATKVNVIFQVPSAGLVHQVTVTADTTYQFHLGFAGTCGSC